MLGTAFVQSNVDLTRAEDYAVDLVVGKDGLVVVGGVGDDPLEVRLASEVFDRGTGERVS